MGLTFTETVKKYQKLLDNFVTIECLGLKANKYNPKGDFTECGYANGNFKVTLGGKRIIPFFAPITEIENLDLFKINNDWWNTRNNFGQKYKYEGIKKQVEIFNESLKNLPGSAIYNIKHDVNTAEVLWCLISDAHYIEEGIDEFAELMGDSMKVSEVIKSFEQIKETDQYLKEKLRGLYYELLDCEMDY